MTESDELARREVWLDGPAQITHEKQEEEDAERRAAEAEVEALLKKLQMQRRQAQ